MQPPASIQGSEAVVAALGWWPSFHDAEVLSFALARGAAPDDHTATARLRVQVRYYEPRNEGTARYEMSLVKNIVVELLFEGVDSVNVEDFNFQNVINAIEVQQEAGRETGRLRVEVESIFGFGASWLCDAAAVERVVELDAGEA